MKFWESHSRLRVMLIAACFILGLAFIFAGLSLSGQLLGVGVMAAGLAALLFALWLYNKPFTDGKKK